MASDLAVMIDLNPCVEEDVLSNRTVRPFPGMAHPLNATFGDLCLELGIQTFAGRDRSDADMDHIIRQNHAVIFRQQIGVP